MFGLNELLGVLARACHAWRSPEYTPRESLDLWTVRALMRWPGCAQRGSILCVLKVRQTGIPKIEVREAKTRCVRFEIGSGPVA